MTRPGFTTPAALIPDAKDQSRQVLARLRDVGMGKINAVTQITLAANATYTTLTDTRIGALTHISFSPLTAHAAAALGGLYVSARKNGQATLTHASSANGDQTFSVLLIG